jgi:hypothetical protein
MTDIVDVLIDVLGKRLIDAARAEDKIPRILKDEKPYVDVEARVIEDDLESKPCVSMTNLNLKR